VVVGEDHPIFWEGLIGVLEGDGFELVAAAGNAEDVVRKTRAGPHSDLMTRGRLASRWGLPRCG